ncbi:hypothetical protein J5U46_06545 [Micromonospora tulbaghiae]|uniref:LigA protein n=1 Tax=Micromonospora tulbaghiae TaxID=479978 RepID=A0AAW4JEL3_9ACTN|nr:hypothetical protein [Micromonospora tulbaghiae]MBO4139804.1 hypothetical protein [Micromonospora tulbaghiae]MDX5458764.1 hypothetical protein [Micromonospora tulbaghiae]SCE78263.1 hypothetical protein GA0070562_2686 [Micromonospora tulbaghiae]
MIEQETQPEALPGPRNAPEGLPVPPATSVPRAVWQVRVRTKLDDLYQQLAVLATRDLEQAAALRAQLSGVEAVLGRSGVIEWLRGGNLEYAWQTIHSVERGMVALRSPDELTGLLPAYRSAAAQVLPADDKVLTDLDPSAGTPSDALLRARVQALLLRYHSASDEFHESARRLRNRMLGLSVFALVAEVLVVLVQWRSHDVRLLEAPTDAGAVPAWRLLFFVLIAGALGAFLSALPSMITSRSGGLPYKLPFQQGLLKLAIGPLVAVVGIMLVIGGLVETSVSSTAALLGLAIVFGAGQQAVTAFADRRAAELLGPAAKS